MDRITFYSFVILAMVLILPILSHILRKKPSMLKWVNYLILGIYLFANLYLTLLSRETGSSHSWELTPFWSYVEAIHNWELFEEVILNIILYIPLGYLLHYAFPKLKWWMIVVIGFLLSGFTESTQLILKLGLCEIDDLISNTLGTIIGVILYKGYKSLFPGENRRS